MSDFSPEKGLSVGRHVGSVGMVGSITQREVGSAEIAQPRLMSQLDELSTSVNDLRDRLVAVIGQLEPILLPTQDCDKVPADKPYLAFSSMASSHVEDIDRQVRNLRTLMMDLSDRIRL